MGLAIPRPITVVHERSGSSKAERMSGFPVNLRTERAFRLSISGAYVSRKSIYCEIKLLLFSTGINSTYEGCDLQYGVRDADAQKYPVPMAFLGDPPADQRTGRWTHLYIGASDTESKNIPKNLRVARSNTVT
jgi:hypothetical protein